jgi:hypothetical protein
MAFCQELEKESRGLAVLGLIQSGFDALKRNLEEARLAQREEDVQRLKQERVGGGGGRKLSTSVSPGKRSVVCSVVNSLLELMESCMKECVTKYSGAGTLSKACDEDELGSLVQRCSSAPLVLINIVKS